MPTPRLSIRNKWTLALVAAAWLPLLVACWRGLEIQREGLRRVEQELEAAVVDQVSGELTLAFDEVTDVARYAAKIAVEDSIPAATRTALLRDRVGIVDSLSSLALYAGDRSFIDALVKPDVTPPSRGPLDSALYDELVATGSAQRVMVDPATGQVTAMFAASNEERLFVVAYLDVGVIAERTKRISTVRFRVPDRIDVVAPAADGSFRSMTFAGRTTKLPPELLPKNAAAETAGALFRTELLGTTEYSGADGELSATLRSVPSANLAVLVVRPTREAYVALERTKQQFLVVILAVAVLAVSFGWFFARQITRPIGMLVKLVRRYAQRDWSARSSVHTGDELESLGSALSSMAVEIATSEEELTRRAAVEAGLARYLPTDVARQIASGERTLELGGERRDVTVLFADVANFTRFAESRPVEDVVAFLNELFGILSEVVFRHGGMVDKFLGDCVMALFGASASLDGEGALDARQRAVAAAEDMMRFVDAKAEDWQRRWGFEVKLGIGIATGPALVGNLGSEARMEFTAIGDTVNVASRLEGLARPGQVLVTTEVADATRAEFDFAPIGKVPIRGKSEDVELHALITD